MKVKFDSVDDYLKSFDGVTNQRLKEVRALLRTILPDAEERISYNIPAFFLNNKPIIYFAGYDKHIGIYPVRIEGHPLEAELKPYASGKASLRFYHNKPLPKSLISKIITTQINLKSRG